MDIQKHTTTTLLQEELSVIYTDMTEMKPHLEEMSTAGYTHTIVEVDPLHVSYFRLSTHKQIDHLDTKYHAPALIDSYYSEERDVKFARDIILEFENFANEPLPNGYKNRLILQVRGFMNFGVSSGRKEVATLLYTELCTKQITHVSISEIEEIISKYISIYELQKNNEQNQP